MLDGLMKSWKIDSREKLVLAANATPPPDFAALFPSVLALADSGDPVARDVLTELELDWRILQASSSGVCFRTPDQFRWPCPEVSSVVPRWCARFFTIVFVQSARTRSSIRV